MRNRRNLGIFLQLLFSFGVTSQHGPTQMSSMLDLSSILAVFNSSAARPMLDFNEYWGPRQNQGYQDTNIRPAAIHFDERMIEDLRYRLRTHVPFRPPLEDTGFTYGFNTDAIEYWLHYWAEEYPFKEREAFLNQFPQFRTNIQGLDIHFIWVKPRVPPNKEVLPVLLLHGWPGSMREFYEVIPILTADYPDKAFAVEVIVPCLPGFGFSDAAVRPGLGAPQIAVVMRNLMQSLGFQRFYIQGGDWGGFIGSMMSTIFPQEILGYHTNWAFVLSPQAILSLIGSGPRLPGLVSFLLEESGYIHQAATKPDTEVLGYHTNWALVLTPQAIKSSIGPKEKQPENLNKLAFVVEETGYLHLAATKPDTVGVTPENRNLPDGGLRNTFTPEQLIDDVMMYWTCRTITTSLRLYAETLNKKTFALGIGRMPTPVPTWVAQGKNELTPFQSPEVLMSKYTNLLNATELEFGGHFLALERPRELAENLLIALSAFRDWHRNQLG